MVETPEAPSETKRSRIFVLDDHPILRQGMALLVNQQDDLVICGEAEDALTALNSIESSQPDLMIVDISLKGTNGIDFIKRCLDKHPDLPILVLSMHDESLYAERALRAGARGYIMKKEATENLLEAIRVILNSGVYLSKCVSDRMEEDWLKPGQRPKGPLERLSDRELEILEQIGRGRKTRIIAEEFGLSVKTVEAHREHIKAKLKIDSANELLRYATQWTESMRME
ncbi:MAG: response regulator transcription factor [Planctomycetota bacterium]|jgi:DNA-binding NarL/FixJ family response regulator|nr:response regulator transcription factor [Planctomycetota bacterium]MDP6503926.1 response regulator transcription factor [Planctomycetota bacterium]